MSTEVIQIWEFDNLHMTQCAKIIVGFMANVGNVFYPTFTNVLYFLHVFYVFYVFLFSSQRLLRLCTYRCRDAFSPGCAGDSGSIVSCECCIVSRRRGDHTDETWPLQAHCCTSCTADDSTRHQTLMMVVVMVVMTAAEAVWLETASVWLCTQ